MAADEVGVDPGEAKGYGTQTVSISEHFSGISDRFMNVCLDTEEDSGKGRLKLSGFSVFGQDCRETMTEVQQHGTQMGGNMVAGAQSAEDTDQENMTEFERSSLNVPGNDVDRGHGPWAPSY